MTGIYKWTSPSGKIYIGQAVDLNRRKREFLANPFNYVYTSYDSAIDNARRKYNDFSQWQYEILINCDMDALDDYEQEYINQYNSTNKDVGYNLTLGGDGTKGVKWGSKKQIESLLNRKSVKGENNPMYGKHHTQEVKDLISTINKGRKMTEEQKALRSKSVLQFTKQGDFIKKWQGASFVMNETGIDKTMISRVCKGNTHCKSAGGFIWKYYQGFFLGDLAYTVRNRVDS